ncbi:MAG: shikimate kinase, partial [Firmicutes bacterium]|nr:shikimate kinase [Bacillota bacterium]
LVRQATEAAGYFHPKKKDEYLGRTEEILSGLESSIENIVLIGMPGSGKTSIGKRLAKELGREFVDTDRAARELAGRSPAEIIKESGEQAFRDIESEAVRMVAKEHSAVIATGGGTPLRPENIRALKQNGRVFFLDRDPDKLSTFNRPLSQNGGVYKLYDQRYDIYKAACDEPIKNNGEDFTPSFENILKCYR